MNTQIIELVEAIEAAYDKYHEWGEELEVYEVDTEYFSCDVFYEAEFGEEEGVEFVKWNRLRVDSIEYVGEAWKDTPVPSQEELIACVNILLTDNFGKSCPNEWERRIRKLKREEEGRVPKSILAGRYIPHEMKSFYGKSI